MANTIQTKRCSHCKQFKPISEFCKNQTRKDGFQNHCRACQKIYAQSEKGKAAHIRYDKSEKGKAAHRINQKRFHIRNPDYMKANIAIGDAVQAGRLPRPDTFSCHYCSKSAKQYHHYKGYACEHWLDVVPVCIPCHKEIHYRT